MAIVTRMARIDVKNGLGIHYDMLGDEIKVGHYIYMLDCPVDKCLCISFKDRECPYLKSLGWEQEWMRLKVFKGRYISFTIPEELRDSNSFLYRTVKLVYYTGKNVMVLPWPAKPKGS